MPEVNANVEATEAAPKAKKVKPVAKAAKKATKVEKKPVKATKAKAERSDRMTQEDKSNRILKYLAKQSKPVTRAQIVAGSGVQEGINRTCNKILGPSLVKREAAKFHDMGRGMVFTLTANGKKAAAKIK